MTATAWLGVSMMTAILFNAMVNAGEITSPEPTSRSSTQPAQEKIDPKYGSPQTASSDSVTDNGVKFVAFAPKVWMAPAPSATTAIALSIEVTNTTGQSMQLNLNDTVNLVIKDAQGVEVPYTIHRFRSFIPDPLVIKDKETRPVRYSATLKGSADNTGLTLYVPDACGGTGFFEPLKPGRYTLSFTLENDPKRLEPVLSRPVDHRPDMPFWMGTVTMGDIAFSIADAPAKP